MGNTSTANAGLVFPVIAATPKGQFPSQHLWMEQVLSRMSKVYKLRHWPPGTNNIPFVPSFFARPLFILFIAGQWAAQERSKPTARLLHLEDSSSYWLRATLRA